MPSVPAAAGAAARPGPTAATAPGAVRSPSEVGQRRRDPVGDVDASPRPSACRRSTRASRPDARSAAAAVSSSRWSVGERVDGRGIDAPARLGPPTEDAEPAARRVDEHAVERAARAPPGGGRRRPRVRPCRGRAGAPPRTTRREAAGVHVDRDDAAGRADPLRNGRGLAARRGGDVEDAVAGLRCEDVHDRLARLVLRRGAPVARPPAARPGRRRRARRARRARAHPSRRARPAASSSSRSARRRRARRVRAERDRGRLVRGDEHRPRVLRTEVVAQPRDEPVGIRERDRRRRPAPATAALSGRATAARR